MRRQLVTVALTVSLFALAPSKMRGAGPNAADEAAIRKEITNFPPPNSGSLSKVSLPDLILWTGAYKRPMVGDEKGEPFTGTDDIANRVPGSQKAKIDVVRIVVADSRDLAYEYSKGNLEYDLKSGEHRSFMLGLLRVWQKQNGDWKVAAFFTRPYDASFVSPAGK